MLGEKIFLKSIKLHSLLSFSDSSDEFDLRSLNVLIGPNASGKSNLFDAIDFLRESPRDLTGPVKEGGGVADWLFKGASRTPTAEINAVLYYPSGSMGLRHRVNFTMVGQRFQLVDEAVENERPEEPWHQDVRFFYRYQQGHPVLNVVSESESLPPSTATRTQRRLRREDLAADQSVLSQRRDPDLYPELTYLANEYSKIRLYRDWNLGRHTAPRLPQKTDLSGDFLDEDAGNLALVLNDLENKDGMRAVLLNKLRQFHRPFNDIYTKVHGGTIQVNLHEEKLRQPIPATRLSDGTLRYLCLLSILCHPAPPPLVCIEEPEIGLHPDIIPTIAELLLEASHRTQLIVSTHSDELVDALSDEPEAVVVCEKDEGSTRMTRLSRARLSEWLEKYRLGELWRRGELGGNRW